mmetsp:Transcript_84383/g.261020  ORF Transcript_84383/g.261020 Transcript_84383/m.261020 type:complete len:420 (+) Transcript_84383:106-1365(+)
MPTLYLIDCSDGAVRVLSEYGQDRWLSSRWSPLFLKSRRHVLLRGPEGWRLQDQSPGPGYGRCLLLPAGGGAGSSPPLGAWRSADGKCEFILSDRCSECPPLQKVEAEEGFVSMTYVEKGDTSRLDIKLKKGSITDDRLERVLSRSKEVLISLARRPQMTLMMTFDLQEAAVPSMKYVRRFIAFAQETGDILSLVVRGNAMIVKPTGIVGNAFVSIIKMMQRILQADWPETIVPSMDEANQFLARLRPTVFKDEEHVASGIVLGEVQKSSKVQDGPAAPMQVSPQILPLQSPPATRLAEAARHPGLCRAKSTGSLRSSKTGASTNALTDACSSSSRWHAPRRRPNTATHPDLAKLEVPVWVAMGYGSRRVQPGLTDSKVSEADADIEGEREPVLCSCSCKSKGNSASQPRLRTLFALGG